MGRRRLKPLTGQNMGSDELHQVNASPASEKKLTPLWAILLGAPLAVQPRGMGSQKLSTARQPGKVPDLPGVLPECRMSKPVVTQGENPTDLILVPLCPGGFEVPVEADGLEKSEGRDIANKH